MGKMVFSDKEMKILQFFDLEFEKAKTQNIIFDLKYLRKNFPSPMTMSYRVFGGEKQREIFSKRYGMTFRDTRCTGKSTFKKENILELKKIVERDSKNWPSFKLEMAKKIIEGKESEVFQMFQNFGKYQSNKKRFVQWLLGENDSKMFHFLERAMELQQIYKNGPNYRTKTTLMILEELKNNPEFKKIPKKTGISKQFALLLVKYAKKYLGKDYRKREMGKLYKDYKKITESMTEIYFPDEKEFLRLRVDENKNLTETSAIMGIQTADLSVMELSLLNKAVGSEQRHLDNIYKEMLKLYALYKKGLKDGIFEECLSGIEKYLFEQVSAGYTLSEIKKRRMDGLKYPTTVKNTALGKLKKILAKHRMWKPGDDPNVSGIDLGFGSIEEVLEKLAEKETPCSAPGTNGDKFDISLRELADFLQTKIKETGNKSENMVWQAWFNNLASAHTLVN